MDWKLFLKLVWYNEWIQTDIHYTFTLTAISATFVLTILLVFCFCKGNHEVVKVKVWSYTLTTKCRCYYSYCFDSLLQRNRLDLKRSWMIFPRRNLKVRIHVQLDHFKNQTMKLWLKLIICINFESEIHSGKINNWFLTNSNDQIHASTNRSNLLFLKRQKLLN